MQPKSLPPPPDQPTLPLEISRRAGPPPGKGEVLVGHYAPEEVWGTLETARRDRLRKAWLRVLKEVLGDAPER